MRRVRLRVGGVCFFFSFSFIFFKLLNEIFNYERKKYLLACPEVLNKIYGEVLSETWNEVTDRIPQKTPDKEKSRQNLK